MNNSITTGILRELGNHGMADEFSSIIILPIQRRPSLEAAVAKMAEAEQLYRKKAKAEKLLKAAKLRMKAFIEDVECSIARNLTDNLPAVYVFQNIFCRLIHSLNNESSKLTV